MAFLLNKCDYILLLKIATLIGIGDNSNLQM